MDAARLEYLKADFVKGFTAYLGFEALEAAPGRFVSAVRLGAQHLQQDGFAHAGVVTTLADHTGGYAAFTRVEQSKRILTIEFKINFFRPARGQRLVCRSHVVHQGQTILVSNSEVTAEDGDTAKTIAQATITLMAVPAHKTQGR